MKAIFKIFPALPALLVFTFAAAGQADLQRELLQLTAGKTTAAEIRSKFGEPAAVERVSSWKLAFSPNRDYDYQLMSPETPDEIERNLFKHVYPKLGVTFFMFDRPSQLYSFIVRNPSIVFQGLRADSSLENIVGTLGEGGRWLGTRDNFVLEYRKAGLRFTFNQDPNFPKNPMKLKAEAVATSIEVFNPRVGFIGTKPPGEPAKSHN